MHGKGKLERDLMGDTSAHDRGGFDEIVASGAAIAFSPLTLVGALVAVIAAFARQPLGLLLVPIAMLVGLIMRLARGTPPGWERELSLVLPEPTRYADLGARGAVMRLRKAREALKEAACRAGGLPPGLRGVGQLERRALTLAARAEYVGTFLACRSNSDWEAQTTYLGSGHAMSEAVRDARRRATDACARNLEDVCELRAQHELVLATLDHVLGALEGLPARLVRVRLQGIEACSGPASDAVADVARLGEEVELLESAVRDPTEPAPPAATAEQSSSRN